MNTNQTIEFENKFDEKETSDVIKVIASSLIVDSAHKTKYDLDGISVFVTFFSRTLEEIMQNDIVKSKQDKLKVIKFIDKLNQQKHSLEIATANKMDLQIAAERLGKKAQSSFGT